MHCLSFDVEEHFQVSAFWSEARRQQWDKYESRVENNTRKLVELLAKHDTKATFFVLGWVAERYPGLVKMLVEQGHEIAVAWLWTRIDHRSDSWNVSRRCAESQGDT